MPNKEIEQRLHSVFLEKGPGGREEIGLSYHYPILQPVPGKLYRMSNGVNYWVNPKDAIRAGICYQKGVRIVSEGENPITVHQGIIIASFKEKLITCPPNSIILYVGSHGRFHKIGYKDLFGLVLQREAVFFDPEDT